MAKNHSSAVFTPRRNEAFLEKATALTPTLYHTAVTPLKLVAPVADPAAFQGWRMKDIGSMADFYAGEYRRGDTHILDFGSHFVGYVSFDVTSVGSPQDAPLRLHITFGEIPCEMGVDFAAYDGDLSKSWLQEELLTIDVLPAHITLPGRYSFRYMKIEVVDTSMKYRAKFSNLTLEQVSSARDETLRPLPPGVPEWMRQLDEVSVRTLKNCMQTVLEDGPKRDKRLWLGDLRLQALVNYQTYGNFDLVKRCLYLFAGITTDEGQVGACLFEKPEYIVDDTLLFDYSLFFTKTLCDYYEASGDAQTLIELWPTAYRQIEIALKRVDERGVVRDSDDWWCFLDWQDELNKQAGAQGVLIYVLRQAVETARGLGYTDQVEMLEQALRRCEQGAKTYLYDPASGFFISGEARQVSWASQVWMVLAGILPQAENAALLQRLAAENPPITLSTPYMHHHLVEAYLAAGMKEAAEAELDKYWGGMVRGGADCFYEVYDPDDMFLSPYGSNLINSYCHAWSCTPAYFIRKYFAG